ncbi:MAG TPA: AMP-binding protein, partial [Elusimicrobiota bacterium]|nr:AMP-binding protein [Elusimicrobiota bacterium]
MEAPWVDGLTIPEVLERTAARFGPRDALVFPELRYRKPWTQLLADVRRTARALMALGVEKGEHVGVWSTNWPQWVVLQFACAEIGAVLVNINPAYRAHELEYVLRQADITTLFLTDRFKGTDYPAVLGEIPPGALPRLKRAISIHSAAAPGLQAWPEFLARAAEVSERGLARRRAQVAPDDVANIQYTSGTTGFPKGAMLTHRNLLMNAWHVGERQSFGPDDRLCLPVPFYHCFGCV